MSHKSCRRPRPPPSTPNFRPTASKPQVQSLYVITPRHAPDTSPAGYPASFHQAPTSGLVRPRFSGRHRAASASRSRPLPTSPARPSPRKSAADPRSTCVAELALLLLLLAIETAPGGGGGGGGGSGVGGGCPIDTSRPGREKAEPELRRTVQRRRFLHVLTGALHDDARARGRGTQVTEPGWWNAAAPAPGLTGWGVRAVKA